MTDARIYLPDHADQARRQAARHLLVAAYAPYNTARADEVRATAAADDARDAHDAATAAPFDDLAWCAGRNQA